MIHFLKCFMCAYDLICVHSRASCAKHHMINPKGIDDIFGVSDEALAKYLSKSSCNFIRSRLR